MKEINNIESVHDWFEQSKKNKTKVLNYKLLSHIRRKDSDFTIATIDFSLKHKNIIYKRAIQFEGISGVIIPILYFKKEKYTVLVNQFRAPLSKFHYEFPSGKIKANEQIKSVLQEIEEELNITLKKKEIKKINKKPIYLLPANNFSKVFFYFFKKKINLNFFKKYANLETGNKKEGEYIKLKIVKFSDLKKFSNSASIIIGESLIKNEKIL